jgi:uncharacterized protein (TIGR02145 family)
MKRTKTIWIYSLGLLGLLLVLQYGCKKDSSSGSQQNPNAGPDVTDVDGNVYHSVIIGTQVWMAENLKTTKYRNSNAIPNVTDSAQWAVDTTAAYCNNYNNSDTAKIYGRLYNWYAVANVNNIAPTGWHVPSDSEWTVLTTYLGTSAGGKLKATGTTYWNSPNYGATNSSGFGALAGGDRSYVSAFHNIGIYGFWWSSTAADAQNAVDRIISNTSDAVYSINYPKNIGFSVRCVKDK